MLRFYRSGTSYFGGRLAAGYPGALSSPTSRVVVAPAVVAAAIFLSSCGSPAPDHRARPSQDQPVISGEPAGNNAQDVAFAFGVLEDSQQAVGLSKLVPDRSTNPKIITFGAARSSTLQSDIQVLKVMLVQWNENPNAGGDRHGSAPAGMVDQATIAKLNASRGEKFDTLWLRSMIGLDQGAVAIANTEIAGKNNDDAVGLARQIVQARQADIGTMKQLLGG